MSVRDAALGAILVLSLAGCGKGHDAPHAATESKTHPVVVSMNATPSEREIAALYDQWNETLRLGGPHDMALLYAEDGVLLPTFSNQVRSNRVEIADYFEHFLALHPRGTINEQHIAVLDPNTAVNSGVYTFDTIKEGQPAFVAARYSFLYEKIGGKWLIKSHHSSAMPEAVAVRLPPLAQTLASAEPAPAATHAPSAPAPTAHH